MKNWLLKFLAIAVALSMIAPMAALAEVNYPVDTDVTLSLWHVISGGITAGGYSESAATPGFQAWEEKSGIKIDLREFIDMNSMILAVLGADKLPDMLMFDPSNYPGGIPGMVKDGIVEELTVEELEKYAPDYWAYINREEYLDALVQLDGKMYNFAGHVFEPNSIYRYFSCIFYRGDLLDKAGVKVPETIDEFYDMLVALKGLDGIEVPWVFNNNMGLRSSMNEGIITSPFGLVCTDEYQVDGVWHYGAAEPEYREVLRFAKKLYDEGLISVDYLSMESSQAQAMIVNGTAGAFWGGVGRMGANAPLLNEGEYFVAGSCLRADDAEKACFSFADNQTGWGDATFITTDCQHRDLCLNFLNWVYTEEGNMVRNMGIEGVSYYIDENGKPQYTEFVTNNPDGYTIEGLTRCYGLIDWPGIHADFQQELRQALPCQVQAFEAWSKSDHDKYAVNHKNVLDEYADDYTNLWSDISTYIDEARAKFISGALDLDADFDAYIETLNAMGMDRIYEMKQATLDAYNARGTVK